MAKMHLTFPECSQHREPFDLGRFGHQLLTDPPEVSGGCQCLDLPNSSERRVAAHQHSCPIKASAIAPDLAQRWRSAAPGGCSAHCRRAYRVGCARQAPLKQHHLRTPFSENDRRGESDESPAHDDNIGLVHSAIVPPLRTVASDGYFDLKRPTRSPPHRYALELDSVLQRDFELFELREAERDVEGHAGQGCHQGESAKALASCRRLALLRDAAA